MYHYMYLQLSFHADSVSILGVQLLRKPILEVCSGRKYVTIGNI